MKTYSSTVWITCSLLFLNSEISFSQKKVYLYPFLGIETGFSRIIERDQADPSLSSKVNRVSPNFGISTQVELSSLKRIAFGIQSGASSLGFKYGSPTTDRFRSRGDSKTPTIRCLGGIQQYVTQTQLIKYQQRRKSLLNALIYGSFGALIDITRGRSRISTSQIGPASITETMVNELIPGLYAGFVVDFFRKPETKQICRVAIHYGQGLQDRTQADVFYGLGSTVYFAKIATRSSFFLLLLRSLFGCFSFFNLLTSQSDLLS